MTHPNQPPFTEHERVVQALGECATDSAGRFGQYECDAFMDLEAHITPEGARKLVALLRL